MRLLRPFLLAAAAVAAAGTLTGATCPQRAAAPPPVNGRFDYQIGGAYRPAHAVVVVDRDRHAAPARHRYTICYVNSFQTQGDEASFWTGSHRNLLLHNSRGELFIDPDWPDEYLLDTSTAARRAAIAAIEKRWIAGCARDGFRAVEPDNLDTFTRAEDPYTHRALLSRSGNLALARKLAGLAHAHGLAFAQKNTAELTRADRDRVGFDFAIAEECEYYHECGDYTRVYGDHVIEIEYTDNPGHAFRDACRARGDRISVILRDRDVVPAGDPAYRYRAC